MLFLTSANTSSVALLSRYVSASVPDVMEPITICSDEELYHSLAGGLTDGLMDGDLDGLNDGDSDGLKDGDKLGDIDGL